MIENTPSDREIENLLLRQGLPSRFYRKSLDALNVI